MEAVDGGDVREDTCGDFQRDPCFYQPGAENLGTQWSLSMGHHGWDCASAEDVGTQERL